MTVLKMKFACYFLVACRLLKLNDFLIFQPSLEGGNNFYLPVINCLRDDMHVSQIVDVMVEHIFLVYQ